jgi:4-methyl-5(b-hydroxyethyl)-thiazole monophosphate biosynthesis
MSKTALVPIADGSEEIEAVAVIDVLRRAGVSVTVASVMDRAEITASRGVRIVADQLISEVADQNFDLIVLPGGMPGAEHLRDSAVLTEMLRRHAGEDRLVGAICAAPAVALKPRGLLEGRQATAHPGFFDQLDPETRSEARVVADGRLVTSRGPGTALEFALRLVALLLGEEKAAEVAGPMVVA